MSDWLSQYSAALDVRDAREQAHKPYIDAYTRLADRTANAGGITPGSDPGVALPSSTAFTNLSPAPTQPKSRVPPPASLPGDLPTLRADLANTQKARSVLQSRVDDLSGSLALLQRQEQRSTGEIAQLKRQKGEVERKLRDREEEIRGKASLVEGAQDEMVALEMQLNLSEQRREALEKENKELVERWVKRMGEEVDKINRDNKWE